ncbi:hypothetical protein CCYN2B_60051 [Capnocytophaga cynodegmi]|uniref:Uncharacterized protein n=1 Tax=Capnocytophaga cynodegmi TaxID=28189 RepID=A0A0B7HNW7_9FLAO|nr:hypothetical protein CCYN2B_60051 [Capnocytophaga cynodegmi]
MQNYNYLRNMQIFINYILSKHLILHFGNHDVRYFSNRNSAMNFYFYKQLFG